MCAFPNIPTWLGRGSWGVRKWSMNISNVLYHHKNICCLVMLEVVWGRKWNTQMALYSCAFGVHELSLYIVEINYSKFCKLETELKI